MGKNMLDNHLATQGQQEYERKGLCPLCGRNLSEAEDDITPEVEEEPGHNFYECACGYRFTED